MNQFFNKLKTKLFPSSLDKMVKRWEADGGDEQFRFGYDLNEESVVLDLGAFDGQWASDIYSRYNCYIYLFEPVYLYAEKIRKRFSKNTKIKVHPFALGSSNQSTLISVSGTSSSVYLYGNNKQEIQIVDVAEWIKQAGLTTIDLVKINIEGGEYELMDRLIESNLIEQIRDIQIQFHEISPNSRVQMARIQQHLSRTHERTYSYEFIWENWSKKTLVDEADA